MVKALLEYYPYAGETKVEFNGKSPRINSLVEKNKHKIIQEWIKEIPQIFHDEMNGYDFDLEFYGPKMDYEQLEKAFSDAGLNGQVNLFQKKEMDDREQTRNAIYDLLKWLGGSPQNGLFDSVLSDDSFTEVLNEDYAFKTINGDGFETDWDDGSRISFENITSLGDLHDVDLNNTPIIINVTEEVIPLLKTLIDSLTGREDVYDNQVFFIISSELKEEMIQRTINDLGMVQLQVVDSLSDKEIKEYYYAYPVTDYIQRVLRTLKQRADEIDSEVKEKESESEITNKETYEQIKKLDNKLLYLRAAFNQLRNRDNPEIPGECLDAKKYLLEKIMGWKKSKVYSSEENAAKNAEDYSRELGKYLDGFVEKNNEIVNREKNKIADIYSNIYASSGNHEIEIEKETISKPEYEMPDLKSSFLNSNKQKYEPPAADLKERFFGEKGPVYYYAEWREYALDALSALADDIIKKQCYVMNNQLNVIAEKYIEAIDDSITQNEVEREEVALKLSNDERKLQDEKKWMIDLKDKIRRIERG